MGTPPFNKELLIAGNFPEDVGGGDADDDDEDGDGDDKDDGNKAC